MWMLNDILARKRKNEKRCGDCGHHDAPTVYFFGNRRCVACTAVFTEARRFEQWERSRREQAALEAHKAAGCPDDGITCPDCCDHSDRDDHCCMTCGQEMGEIDACAAEYYYEGDR